MGIFNRFKSDKDISVEEVKSCDSLEIVEFEQNIDENLPAKLTRSDYNQLESLRKMSDLGSKLCDIYIENKRINANIKALRIQTNAVINIHAQNIAATRELVTKVFAERAIGLKKHYEVLDKALKSDDREMIIASLQGISSIIVANPVDQIAKFANMLHSPNSKLRLDF